MDEAFLCIRFALLHADGVRGFISDEIDLVVLQVLLELRGRVLAGKAVGVIAVGEEQELDVHTFGQEHVDASFTGMDACVVAVEDDGDVFRDAMDEVYLFGSECGAGR